MKLLNYCKLSIQSSTANEAFARSTVAAFCDNECRGVARVVDGLLYMNIYGEGGETIRFKFVENGVEVEREVEFFGWERLDAVEIIKSEFGL